LLAIEPGDGKIIVNHQFMDANSVAHSQLARLNTDGTLDSSFTLEPQTRAPDALRIAGVAFQPDGRLLLAGDLFADPNNVHESIARLDATANIDPAFAPHFETAEGQHTAVLAVAVQSDNSIVFGGTFNLINDVSRTNLARITQNGTLDTGFAPVLQATSQANAVSTIFVQQDGKILIGGSFTSVNGTNRSGIARLNTDGSLDSSFDVGSGTGDSGRVEATIYQPDGKLLLGGNFTTFNGVPIAGIVRVDTNGSLDMTFSVVFDSCPDCLSPDIRSIGVLSNGVVMLGGAFSRVEGARWNGLARVQTDGSVDPQFNPPVGADEQVVSLVVGKDNKTIVAIQLTDPSGDGIDTRFVRLNPDGTSDASFNAGQVVGDPSASSAVSAMAMDSQGRLVIAGQFSSIGGVARHGLARLNPDGTLDTNFDAGPGFANGVFQPGPSSRPLVSSLALQDNGGIVVGGTFGVADNQVRLGLARFQADQSSGGGGGGGGGGQATLQSPALAADGTFSMKFLGTAGQNYRVDASTDLRSWTPVGNVTGTGALQAFTDSSSKGISARFYRAVTQ
jgi:uncharacterized delta-60 repeat protein